MPGKRLSIATLRFLIIGQMPLLTPNQQCHSSHAKSQINVQCGPEKVRNKFSLQIKKLLTNSIKFGT